MSEKVTAALLIIGDEILSGRTQDKNIATIAKFLGLMGISLQEVRIVSDEFDAIIPAVRALKDSADYLFTTGGIGPTHDDITAEAIAKAFDLPLEQNVEAYKLLADHYGEGNFTDARKRMTRVPKGGILIKNPVSLAPGFQVDNVFTLAGVPKIMEGMLEDIRPRLKAGQMVYSADITLNIGESTIAGLLTEYAENHYPQLSIGSYPFYGEGRYGVQVVFRGTDKSQVIEAVTALKKHALDAAISIAAENISL